MKNYGPSPEEVLVQDLISLMEKGLTPWRRPWDAKTSRHVNLVSGHAYSGSNVFLLTIGMALRNAVLPYWCGADQARKHDVFPKKGSKGVRIIRPQTNKKEVEDTSGEKTEKVWVSYKVCPVFNVADLQGDNLQKLIDELEATPGPAVPSEKERIDNAEKLFADWPVEVQHAGSVACYVPVVDKIMMPKFDSFLSSAAYYATLAHECIHSTGHNSRLARDLSGKTGSRCYAVEELIAEIGAAFCCFDLQIDSDMQNHAAYLDSWIKVLKEEPKALFRYMSAAKKAADLVLGKTKALAQE